MRGMARVRDEGERESEWGRGGKREGGREGERERAKDQTIIFPTNHHKGGPQQNTGGDLHKPQMGPQQNTSGARKASNT